MFSFDEVSVTVEEKLVSVEIFPGEDTSPPSCGTEVKVVSGSQICTNVVLSELKRGYHINRLGYVIGVDFLIAGEFGSTKIWKCEGFTHRCVPDGTNVSLKGSRHTASRLYPTLWRTASPTCHHANEAKRRTRNTAGADAP